MQEMLQQLHTIGAMQKHLLPRQVPHLPGWDLAVHYAVGQWPGGNYYDFLRLPDGRLLFLVADASDRGPPAVALVSMLRVVLHACPLSSGVEQMPFCPFHDPLIQPPHIILGHLNQILFENSLEAQFVTAFCGVFSPADGEVHFANAGHPPPMWWRVSSGTVEVVSDASGLPLGLNAHTSYRHKRIALEPGDVLVFSSDGLTNALNSQDQPFGNERLDRAIRNSASQGAEAIKTTVLADLSHFLEGRKPGDDLTLLVFERVA